ncbi:MAG: hypothetical protein HRK26_01285 [Rickettsiaceae bacterium H1]|nr:hypothetical protein [Rickettsiaceae bacterium H1]
MVISKLLRSFERKSNTGIKLEKPSSDSIPYACHYSPDTILTKNGELLQIIRLEDFHSDRDAREDLRSSIVKNINGDNFAITIHTVRSNNSVSIPWDDKYKKGFPYELHQSWKNRKKSQVDYTNRIYISVIIRGLKNKINLVSLPLNFSLTYLKGKHAKHLAAQYELLSSVTNNIVNDLEHFYAKKLTVDDQGNSELLGLFRSFITLLVDKQKFPLPMQDVSEKLIKDYLSVFGFNSFEVLCQDDKRFASVLGIKRYREVEIRSLSSVMHLNMEFIIAETIDFDLNVSQSKKIEYQSYLFDIGNQEELKEITQLKQFNDKEKCVNHYINIIPIAGSVNELERSISYLINSFSECGLALFRHDVSLESAFLNILPANFAFRTLSYLNVVDNIAGLALLHAFHAGNIKCKQWGYAITLFWSIHDTPYFFNFHNDNGLGHTTIIGPVNSGKTVLQNFIISESQKIGTRTFIIDYQMKSKIFVNALDGNYKNLSNNDINLSYNPFKIDDSAENKKFVSNIIKTIFGSSESITEEVCNNIFSLTIENRTLENVRKAMLPLGDVVDKLFGKEGLLALLLSESEKIDFWDNKSIGFDISNLNHELSIILILIILHKIESILDGKPTIIVLEEAWKINGLFTDENMLNSFLLRMSKLNCVVIFTTSDIETILSSKFTEYLNKNVATQIFLPGNVVMNKSYTKAFGVTKEDMFMISNLQGHNRHFFLKQGDSSVVLKLDVSDMIESKVLSANKKDVEYMRLAMEEMKSEQAEVWLPMFYDKTKE